MRRLSECSVDGRIPSHQAHPFLAHRGQPKVKLLFSNGRPIGGDRGLPVHLLGVIAQDHLDEFQPMSLFHIGSNFQIIADAFNRTVGSQDLATAYADIAASVICGYIRVPPVVHWTLRTSYSRHKNEDRRRTESQSHQTTFLSVQQRLS